MQAEATAPAAPAPQAAVKADSLVSISGTQICVSLGFALVILILLVVIYIKQVKSWLRSFVGVVENDILPELEHASDIDSSITTTPAPPGVSMLPPGQTSDTLMALGYTGSVPWDEVLQAAELDPATHLRQMEFTKDVKRYSSGANFTDVSGDNNSFAFTNFVGLRRPQHVEIGYSARQVPDIDEDVLKRNKRFVI